MLFLRPPEKHFFQEYLPPRKLISSIKCMHKGKVLNNYSVNNIVQVSLIDDGNRVIHCISEPEVNEEEFRKLYTSVQNNVKPKINRLLYYYEKMLSGIGPLYPLLNDGFIEDIALNKPDSNLVVMNKLVGQGWVETNVYVDEETANLIARNFAKKAGKPLSPAIPFAEGALEDGHRIAVSLGKNISRMGTSFVIRVALKKPYTLPQLVAGNMLSPLMAAYLWLVTEKQGFLMIIGGMATGKTTLMQAILNMLPDSHRVVTIEDTPELNLLLENWDSLVTRIKYGVNSVAMNIGLYELSKFALRRRAEHLVIGETRGVEARVLAQAAATGHGSLSTFHADSIRSALYRLMSDPISLKPGFTGLIWAFIQLKLIGNERRVTRVVEVFPRGPNKFSLISIFKWNSIKNVYAPDNAEDVVERSYRLRMLSDVYGWSKNDVIEELSSRAEFLGSLSRRNIGSIVLRDYLKGYYRVKMRVTGH